MPASRPNILRGVARLAFGRADGLAQFTNTTQGFLASLAPLIAFPLVGAMLMLLRGGGWQAVGDLLATVCALLAPPVLSHALARHWDREARWPRFATAFNWCQWLLPMLASLLLMLLSVLLWLGLPEDAAMVLLVLSLAGYALWLHWFLARHGLALSRGRALLLVIAVNLGTVLLAMGPRLLALYRT